MMIELIKWATIMIALTGSASSMAAPSCPPPMTWDADIGICAGRKIDPTIRSGANLIFESAGIVGIVTQGSGGGCQAGYTFIGQFGGCVSQSQQSESQSQSCGAGYTGTQTRHRYRTVYGHQNGGAQYGAWGAWSAWSGACAAIPAPPSGSTLPAVGQVFTAPTVFVCDASAADWPSISKPAWLPSWTITAVISMYRSATTSTQRCPEIGGLNVYLNNWQRGVKDEFERQNPGKRIADYAGNIGHIVSALQAPVENELRATAVAQGETGPQGVWAANAWCQQAANAKYGSGKITVQYVIGSGNQCKVI